MNREIKFRAWVEEYKTMLPVNSLRSICVNSERLTEEEFDGLIIMQFTGLHDKNGVEIYEGDILHSKSWESSRSVNPYNVVVWMGCGWKAKGYNGQMVVHPELSVKSDFEIIGNIHENPNLIK